MTTVSSPSHPVVDHLGAVLAATYALAVKTHAAHWNVTGPAFFSLHQTFGDQYEALLEQADAVAERLRALGARAPAGMAALVAASPLTDHGPDTRGAALATTLAQDHRTVAALATQARRIASEHHDEVTADLLVGQEADHAKTAWMLEAAAGP